MKRGLASGVDACEAEIRIQRWTDIGVDAHAGREVSDREAGLMELADEVLDLGLGPAASP